ncbi:MAG: DUF1810 domain-containing protein [Phreatobacter sp.]|uniref:DUF1810 domain-containing protein n=1 Tax=Phreatobacter sp. TaxID=1966341 RepID=UPI001A609016|nr:DUF1810 domain-containing protein [Phreatobacter sp.]MBL8569518.1 DUF1810 domain-containing protein [Phreatobacter sp.]
MVFDLQRFVDAQHPVYAQVVRELSAGRKQSHWMWFVFPQMAGLGESARSQFYAIASLDEARAYLAHTLLGPRLMECTALVLDARDKTAEAIFGGIDARKLQSSMTLFGRAAHEPGPCRAVLERFYGGEEDRATLGLLGLLSS